MEQTPHIADRYEVIERIAVGGMAEVYRARALGADGFEKLVALKRIRPELAKDPEFETRFISEAKIAAKLSHTNIVQVFDFGRLAGAPYLTMEYVDGLDLSQLLAAVSREGAPLPIPAALQLAVELCKGLSFAHRRGVIHRDVSPSNVLVSAEGEVKIADFGIAVLSDSRHREQGSVAGKWRYMCPEQLLRGSFDARSDVFSAGAVLFELLSGRALFPGKTPDEVREQVQDAPIVPPGELRPELPRTLDAVLLRALDRDPRVRFADASELLAGLTRAVEVAGVVPSSLELGHLVRSQQARPPPPDPSRGIDNGILAALGGGPPPLGTLLGRRGTQNTSTFVVTRTEGMTELRLVASGAANRRKAKRRLTLAAAGTLLLLALAGGAYAMLGGRAQRLASVDVRSEPAGAAIFVDGRDRGLKTPALLELPDGAATVELQLPGFRPHRESFTLTPGGRHALSAALSPVRRTVRFGSTPEGAEVLLQGRRLGVTPLLVELPADGVEQRAVLRKAGYQEAGIAFAVAPGAEPLALESRLRAEQRYGTIDLHVRPWAEVYLGERKLAEAPVRGLRLPEGRHRLRLVNPIQRREKVVEVTVPAKAPYRFELPAGPAGRHSSAQR